VGGAPDAFGGLLAQLTRSKEPKRLVLELLERRQGDRAALSSEAVPPLVFSTWLWAALGTARLRKAATVSNGNRGGDGGRGGVAANAEAKVTRA